MTDKKRINLNEDVARSFTHKSELPKGQKPKSTPQNSNANTQKPKKS